MLYNCILDLSNTMYVTLKIHMRMLYIVFLEIRLAVFYNIQTVLLKARSLTPIFT